MFSFLGGFDAFWTPYLTLQIALCFKGLLQYALGLWNRFLHNESWWQKNSLSYQPMFSFRHKSARFLNTCQNLKCFSGSLLCVLRPRHHSLWFTGWKVSSESPCQREWIFYCASLVLIIELNFFCLKFCIYFMIF